MENNKNYLLNYADRALKDLMDAKDEAMNAIANIGMKFCGWVLDTTDQIEYALKNKYLFKVRTIVENN